MISRKDFLKRIPSEKISPLPRIAKNIRKQGKSELILIIQKSVDSTCFQRILLNPLKQNQIRAKCFFWSVAILAYLKLKLTIFINHTYMAKFSIGFCPSIICFSFSSIHYYNLSFIFRNTSLINLINDHGNHYYKYPWHNYCKEIKKYHKRVDYSIFWCYF